MFRFTGKRPTNLGVRDGKLAPCPNSPNCVSSRASDGTHGIQPLLFVEFHLEGNAIRVRSASRLGYSDLGVNRKRIEAIRDLFSK